jgi:hypothetical protein
MGPMTQASQPEPELAAESVAPAQPPSSDLLEVARLELANGRALMRRVPLPRTVEPVTSFRADA